MPLTRQTAAVVDTVAFLDAGAPVVARRGAARHVAGPTVRPAVVLRAAAVVGAHLVDADAAVEARRRALGALVDVLLAG